MVHRVRPWRRYIYTPEPQYQISQSDRMMGVGGKLHLKEQVPKIQNDLNDV